MCRIVWRQRSRCASICGVNVEIQTFAHLVSNGLESGHCLVGSLTGVVASKRITEASKGSLSTLGNRTRSAIA